MNNKTLRDHISQQCGFNKTQPQRLLESIIPNKAKSMDEYDPLLAAYNGGNGDQRSNKAIQVCNAGDWPDHLPSSFEDWLRSNNDSIEMPLDRTEATAQWFDNKAKTEIPF